MVDAAVVLDKVSLRYGTIAAVDQVSLAIGRGEIVGLLGPNGSGKSSTLSLIAGVLEPAAGSVRVNGMTRRERPFDFARQIGFVPQELALYDELSAFDNLDFFASLYDLSRRERRKRIAVGLKRVALSDRAGDRVSTFSGGMKRRLNLAAALIHDPAVLLLDEPSAALDSASREVLFELLDELRAFGKTILFATHHLDEAERWCNRIAVLRKGKLISCGTPAEVLRDRFGSAELIGVLCESLSEPVEKTIRQQLDCDVELEIIGRRIRISAPDAEQLGLTVAILGSEGAAIESLSTPPARLEPPADCDTSDPRGVACSGN